MNYKAQEQQLGQKIERLLTIEEVSTLLGVSKATIYSWVSRKKIPHTKFGHKVLRFKESELIEFIESKSFQPGANPVNRKKTSSPKAYPGNEFIGRIIEEAKNEVLNP